MAGAAVPLSVIVPTRDTRALTLQCLASLAVSTHAPAEILVVDDDSRDGTVEAIRAAHPRVRIVTRAAAGGFTAAINEAWPLASSDIVLLLNSDAEVRAETLGRIAEAFARDARLGVAGASLRYPDGRAQWSAGPAPSAAWLFALASGGAATLARVPGWRALRGESQAGVEAWWVPATAMAVRREVTLAIGTFDPALRMYAQDLDYCVRARAAGWRVAQLPEVEVVHLLGATIGASDDAVASRQDPRALFGDLARWIEKAHAPGEARRLIRTLTIGLRLRVAARRAGRWSLAHAEREQWDRDTARYRGALLEVVNSRAALRAKHE